MVLVEPPRKNRGSVHPHPSISSRLGSRTDKDSGPGTGRSRVQTDRPGEWTSSCRGRRREYGRIENNMKKKNVLFSNVLKSSTVVRLFFMV